MRDGRPMLAVIFCIGAAAVGVQHHLGAAEPANALQNHVWTPIGPGWKLTFDDEFNGQKIDEGRWLIAGGPDKSYPQSSRDGALAYWTPQNTRERGGFLLLSVTTDGGADGPFHTAGITSNGFDGPFMQTTGYWEARLKPACNGNGISNAFWTDAANWNYPEIDILEWLGVRPTVNTMTWHFVSPFTGIDQRAVDIGELLCSRFHVLGMWRRADGIVWYLDGAEQFRTTAHLSDDNANPQWLNVQATIGGWRHNFVDRTTMFPSTYKVDYIHVYSNQADAKAVPPQAGYGGPGDALGSGN
jgi:hypothetical protein